MDGAPAVDALEVQVQRARADGSNRWPSMLLLLLDLKQKGPFRMRICIFAHKAGNTQRKQNDCQNHAREQRRTAGYDRQKTCQLGHEQLTAYGMHMSWHERVVPLSVTNGRRTGDKPLACDELSSCPLDMYELATHGRQTGDEKVTDLLLAARNLPVRRRG